MIYGADVSQNQGVIDWDAVEKSKRLSFVYARVFHSFSPSSFGDDQMFASYHDGCKRVGLPFGAYFFYISGRDGIAQADHFLDQAKDRYGELIPMVDVEEGSGAQGWGDSVQARIDNLRSCLARIQAQLGKPIIYTNRDTWNNFFGGTSAFLQNKLWVADHHAPPGKPAHMPRGWPTWTVHQYSNAQSDIHGITATIDLDCLDADDIFSIRRQSQNENTGCLLVPITRLGRNRMITA